MQEVRNYHKNSERTLLIFGSLVSVFALIICGLGIWLIYLDSQGTTKLKLVGQEFESSNVGIASIFIGAVVLIFIVSKMFKSFDKSSDNYTKSIDKIISTDDSSQGTTNSRSRRTIPK